MAPLRRSRAPFEVMRGRADPRPAADGAGDPPGPAAAEGESGPRRTWGQPHPIVVRLPQGYAVLAGAALVGLLVLAYLVGYSKGQKAVLAQAEAEVQQRRDEREAALRLGRPLAEGGQAGGTGAELSQPYRDTRLPGLNYHILARLLQDDALRLVHFLAGQGVEAVAVPIHNTAPQLYHVISLRGIEPSKVSAPETREYELLLRRLGRQWKREERGPDDLSTMYPQKFSGPSAPGASSPAGRSVSSSPSNR